MKVHIVDYGMGNIFSVQKKLIQENAPTKSYKEYPNHEKWLSFIYNLHKEVYSTL